MFTTKCVLFIDVVGKTRSRQSVFKSIQRKADNLCLCIRSVGVKVESFIYVFGGLNYWKEISTGLVV